MDFYLFIEYFLFETLNLKLGSRLRCSCIYGNNTCICTDNSLYVWLFKKVFKKKGATTNCLIWDFWGFANIKFEMCIIPICSALDISNYIERLLELNSFCYLYDELSKSFLHFFIKQIHVYTYIGFNDCAFNWILNNSKIGQKNIKNVPVCVFSHTYSSAAISQGTCLFWKYSI